MKNNWFGIKNMDDDSNTVNVSIYDEIGGWGTTASEFLNQLPKDAKLINLDLHTPGGSVFEGLAIYLGLKHHPANVNITVTGLAASVGSVIMLAGDTRRVYSDSLVMIHNPAMFSAGESSDLRKGADLLDDMKERILNIYVENTGMDREVLSQLMDNETFMGGQEALEMGFATVINGESAVAACFKESEYTKHIGNVDKKNLAGRFIPRIENKGAKPETKTNNNNIMDEQVKALQDKLVEASTQNIVLEAKVKAGEKALAELSNSGASNEEVETLKNQIKDLEGEVTNLKADKEKLEGEKEALGNQNKVLEAKISGNDPEDKAVTPPVDPDKDVTPSYDELVEKHITNKQTSDKFLNLQNARNFKEKFGSKEEYNKKHNLK